MKPFRERNPVVIGVIGLSVIALLLLAAFRADDLPIIGSGDTYYADFAEIGALKAGNEVRVAGVSVGNVKGVELKGDKARVTFKMDKGTKLGNDTEAGIRIRTLLGAEFLALQPKGPGDLPKGAIIPVSRTTPPYDVVQAFSDLSENTDQIDVPALASALDSLNDIAAETPEEFRGAIKGLSALSSNLAARDGEINSLLVNLKKVSGVLNSRNDELVTLFKDSDVLFQAISERRDSIHRLLVSTQSISAELRALVKGTRADLNPALKQLEKVTAMLRRNEASIDESLRIYPGFTRVFANALGTGPWFDTYLAGVPPNLGVAQQLKDALGVAP
ncbi:MCE family protein [Aeromicrobium sp.]|uniref:MCE family protein n=1 Tax=Aeromicrobium sp. TaxID=1871063 RepID=UPI003C509263